jgi:MFS family permease
MSSVTRDRQAAFGVFGSVAAGGGAVGLLLGGVLTQYFSWRWTLYVNLVFAAVAVVGALVYIRSSRPPARGWTGPAPCWPPPSPLPPLPPLPPPRRS